MARIVMTPQELRDAASYLLERKDEILSAVEQLRSKIDQTTAEWEGSAQAAFVEGFEELYPTLHDTFPSVVEGMADQLTGTADALEQADEEIASALRGTE